MLNIFKKKEKVRNLGGAVMSKNIFDGKGNLKWCVREEPVNQLDNGWRFLSDIDDDEFLANPANMIVVAWPTVLKFEPAVDIIFNCPIGADLELVEEDGEKHFYDTNTGIKIF